MAAESRARFSARTALATVVANMIGTGVFTSLGFQLLPQQTPLACDLTCEGKRCRTQTLPCASQDGAEVRGVDLRDGDQPAPKGRHRGLCRLRWQRNEIENYLIHPLALERFVRQEEGDSAAERAREYMEDHLPRAILRDPLNSANVVMNTKGSTTLGAILQEAGVQLRKTEYHRIAATMQPDEIYPEVREKLDAMAAHFKIGEAS